MKNREIKFRVFDKETNSMCQAIMIWLGNNLGVQFSRGPNEFVLSTTASQQGISVIQYTGIKDINTIDYWVRNKKLKMYSFDGSRFFLKSEIKAMIKPIN